MSCLSGASANFIANCKSGKLQQCFAQVTPLTGNDFVITSGDIIQGGFTIDQYVTTTNKLTYGNAIASELTTILYNKNNNFGIRNLEGAMVEPTIMCGGEYITTPTYYIDEVKKSRDTIIIKALDSMILFDKEIPDNTIFIQSGTTLKNVSQLAQAICNACGVDYYVNDSSLANATYTPSANIWEKGMTYRQVIQWLGELKGANAFIDWENRLHFEKWNNNSSTSIALGDRYESTIQEKNIEINGLKLVNNNIISVTPSGANYVIEYVNNKLFQDSSRLSDILATCFDTNKIVYRPFQMTIKSAPYLYPIDRVSFADRNGTTCNSVITHITWTLNRNTIIYCVGDSTIQNSYANIPNEYITKSDPIIYQNTQQDMYKISIGENLDNYILAQGGKPVIELGCPFNHIQGSPEQNYYIPILSFLANNQKYYLVVYIPENAYSDVSRWQVIIQGADMYESYIQHKYTELF